MNNTTPTRTYPVYGVQSSPTAPVLYGVIFPDGSRRLAGSCQLATQIARDLESGVLKDPTLA